MVDTVETSGDPFSSKAFDPDTWIALISETSSVKQLETVKRKLEGRLEGLNNSLIAMIEEDYSAFVKLSAMLLDVNSSVEELRSPVVHVQNQIHQLTSTAEESLDVQRGFKTELQDQSEQVQLLKHLHSVMNQLATMEQAVQEIISIESLYEVDEVDVSSVLTEVLPTAYFQEWKTSGLALVSPDLSKLDLKLSRIGVLSRQLARCDFLSFYSRAGSTVEAPILSELVARREQLSRALFLEVDNCFRQFLASLRANHGEEDPVYSRLFASCTDAYEVLGKVEHYKTVLKKDFLCPALEAIVANHPLHGNRSGSFQNLSLVYTQFLSFVVIDCKMLQQKIYDLQLHQAVPFIEAIVLPAVEEVLLQKLRVQVSGEPSVMHGTYACTDHFLRILSRLCTDVEAGEAFRTRILGNWNMLVYVELVHQSYTKKLEEIQVLSKAKTSGDEFRLHLTARAWELMQSCRDEAIVALDPIKLKLFKVSLELAQWLCRTFESTADSCGTNCQMQITEDLSLFRQKLLEPAYEQEMARFLVGRESPDDGLKSHLNTVFSSLGESIRKIIEKVTERFVAKLLNDVVNDVDGASLTSHLKDILAKLRLRATSALSVNNLQASDYVQHVFQVLRECQMESPHTFSKYKQAVTTHFITVFQEESSKIVAEVRNTEAALKRFRKQKSQADKDGAAHELKTMDTSDVLEAQFQVDLESIQKLAQTF